MQEVIKPLVRSWSLLLIPMLPIIATGLYAVVTGVTAWGILALAFVLVVILYNGSMRLVVTPSEVAFRRYGRLVWRVSRIGLVVVDGRGGDFSVSPAFVLVNDADDASHVLLKGWFAEAAVRRLPLEAVGTPDVQRPTTRI